MSKQTNSDPLPYVQVDRAVKPRAAALADVLGVTRQHALGSLVEFWDLCGEPRELERIVAATPPGADLEVVLTAADIARRFRLASAKEVDPVTLADLGLLEARQDGLFRVRGMSRYFTPVTRRIQARAAAAAGGKARAGAARKAGRFASADPVNGAGEPAGGSGGQSAGVTPGGYQPDHQPDHQPTTSRPPADAPPDSHPGTTPSGQRSADNDGRSVGAAAPPPALALEVQDGRRAAFRATSEAMVAAFAHLVGSAYAWAEA